MRKLSLVGLLLALTAVILMSCDQKSTDTTGNTVTFSLSVPAHQSVNGAAVAVSLWSTWGANSPAFIVHGTFSANTVSLQVPNVSAGTYIAVAAIDANGDGLPSDSPAGAGDLFWGGLDVAIDGNKTISVSTYAWQRCEENSVIIGVTGIPAGHDGQVIAAGIFPNGTDIMAGIELNPLRGSAGLIFNNSAVLSLTPDNDTAIVDLPSGDYDIWMLVDVDGEIQSWNDSTAQNNPITNGDFVASYDFAYNSVSGNDPLIEATFAAVEGFTLTFNVTVPVEYNLDGNSAMGFIFNDVNADQPLVTQEAVISGGTATITLPVVSSWNIMTGVFLDVNGNGFGIDGAPAERGDLLWGTMNLALSADLAIDIPQEAWQEYGYQVVGLEGIPSGHDGEVAAVGMTAVGDNPFNPYGENTIMGGSGLIYNNSAIICLRPSGYTDSTWTLPYADYDFWCLLDVDGSLADYRNSNDSTIFCPVTQGDYYYKYTYYYTDLQAADDFAQVTGSFTPAVGIYGTLSCPGWNSSGGNTYVYLFRENPLISDSSKAYAAKILTAPGSYWLPAVPGDSVYAVGFWDVDNSGEWNGPSQNDLIGGYGSSVDSLEAVQCLELGVGGIDFTLDTPYDTTIYGGGR